MSIAGVPFGMSWRPVADEVASELGESHLAGSTLLKSHRSEGDGMTPGEHPKRPQEMTRTTHRKIMTILDVPQDSRYSIIYSVIATSRAETPWYRSHVRNTTCSGPPPRLASMDGAPSRAAA